MAKQKQKLTEENLVEIIEREVGMSVSYSGELGDQRRKAMEYYNGEPFGNEIAGRSSVVSTDVMDCVEWSMPILMKIFGSGDQVGRFEPQKPEDVEMSEQATDYCNYVFFRENDGFKLLYDGMKDALLSKTGVFKVIWKEDEEVERESYEGLSDEEFQLLVMDDSVEVVEHSAVGGMVEEQAEETSSLNSFLDGTPHEQVSDFERQQEIPMQQPMTHNVTVHRNVGAGKVDIQVVAPEEFYISRSAETIEDAPFVCHRTSYTVSQLIEMGFDEADEYTSDDTQRFDQESVARRFADGSLGSLGEDELDASTREIWVDEAYIKCDWDGDGISEIRKVWKAGGKIILNEEVDRIPFTTICPLPMPHKFYGSSIADIVMDLQLIKSTIWRNILDNIYHLNNGRFECLDGKVNMDDMLTNRPAGVVRVKEMGAVKRLDVPDIGKAPYEMLNYIDQVRDGRTGITKFNQGLDANVLQQSTATAYMQQMQSSQARIDELLQKHSDKPKVVKLRNKWVTVDPSSWRDKASFTVRVGLGNGNREQNMVHLQTLSQMQEKIVAAGGMGLLVTPKNIFNTLKEIGMNMGLKNIEEYLTDHEENMPQQQQQDQGVAQIAQMHLESEKLKFEADKMKVQVDMQKLQVEAQKLEIEKQKLAFEGEKLQADIAMEQQENQLKVAELQMEGYTERPIKIG